MNCSSQSIPEIAPASSVLETALTNLNAMFHPPGMIMNTGLDRAHRRKFSVLSRGHNRRHRAGHRGSRCRADGVASALGFPAQSFSRCVLPCRVDHQGSARKRLDRARLPGERAQQGHQVAAVARRTDTSTRMSAIGLVPFSAFGVLAGVKTPTIDALIDIAGAATGTDFRATGLTLEKMGLARCPPASLARNFLNGRRHNGAART